MKQHILNSNIKIAKNNRGFTLVETMIALQLAAIVGILLFSALYNQYVSVLAESARSSLRSEGLALLTNMQDELLFTIEYGHTLQGDLNDPHAPSGGWDYDTDPQTLIINEIALDGTRIDQDRDVVRRRVNDCTTSPITSNPVALNSIIYFIEDNTTLTNKYLSLKKRVVTPTYDICSIDRNTGDPCDPVTATCFDIAKETTCPDAAVGTGNCERADFALSNNIIDFSVKYFSTNNVETPYPSAAEKIEVSLEMGDRVFGRDVEVEVNHTIRKIN